MNFFLVGPMIEEKDTYVEQAPGFVVEGREDEKSLYGIPPSPRIANEYLCDVLIKKANCKRLITESMRFLKIEDNAKASSSKEPVSISTTTTTTTSQVKVPFANQSAVLSGYFVDDSHHFTNSMPLVNKLKETLAPNKLKGELKIEPKKFLGFEHEYRKNSVLVHQETSILEYIHRLGLNKNSKPVFTPCDERTDDRKESPSAMIDNSPDEHNEYQSETGLLIWLMHVRYASMYAINCRIKKMSKSNKFDSEANKRLARYFLNNAKRGLTFHKGDASFNPLTYAYVDAPLMVHSISGVAVFIGIPNYKTHENLNPAVIAYTKKESEAVTSTMHAELIVVERGIKSLDHVNNIREESGFPPPHESLLFTDNDPGISFVSNLGKCSRQTRHLRRRFRFIQEAVSHRRVIIRHVPSKLNVADILTKPLGRVLFERHSKNLMGDPRDIPFPSTYY